MKKTLVVILTFLVGTITLSAQNIITKSGKCALQEAEVFDDSKLWVKELKNEEVKIILKVRGSEFFDRFVIMTSPSVTNLSDQKKYISFNLVFYDKNGNMIACTSANNELKEGTENMQIGASMSTVTPALLSRITSYQVTVYIFNDK